MTEPTVSDRRRTALLAAILLAGAVLRFVGMDWDNGTHLHPDERFLTMVQSAQDLPASFSAYLATDTSLLNPRNVGHTFFVYGTWPMTIVQFVGAKLAVTLGQLPETERLATWEPTGLLAALPAPVAEAVHRVLAAGIAAVPRWLRGGTDYGTVYLVGRGVSAVMDLCAIVLLYLVGSRLYDRRVGLLAAALAAFTAFHIQQSHFFTVDTATNAFVMLFFLGAVAMVHRHSFPAAAVAGVGMGFALASKIAVWPLAPLAVFALAATTWPRRRERRAWWRFVALVAVVGGVAFAALRVGQPDMFAGPGWNAAAADPVRLAEVTARLPITHWWHKIDGVMPAGLKPWLLPDPRWAGNMEEIQSQVSGQVDFPPNHQWFGRTAYWFPWQNMVLWGMGLPLGLAAWLAWGAAGIQLVRGRIKHLLPWLWITIVFVYQGGQWVKTMRYFIVIYPLLTLLAAWALVALWDRARRPSPAAADPSPVVGVEPSPDRFGLVAARLAAWAERLRDRAPGLARWTSRPRGLAPVLTAVALVVVLGGTMLWGVMVTRIYLRDHTRVAGSRWIYHNLPTAFGLTVKPGTPPGAYMPAGNPNDLSYDVHTYTLAEDERLDAMRVLVPGDEPVVIDGANVGYATDPAADAAPEVYRAWLTTSGLVDGTGNVPAALASGEVTVALTRDAPTQVRIPLAPETTLEPGGEYYLWLAVEGAPVSGRPSILAAETTWDDPIPLGLDGYGGYDDPGSSWGEGMFGSTHLELFYEDVTEKVDTMIGALEGADYVVISSNRVYGSVDQMPTRFPMTLAYYDLLFSGRLGFDHIGDIHSYPGIDGFEVPDQAAEEAWSVYDHPKVDIFAKTDAFDPAATRAELEAQLPLRTWVWPARGPGIIGLLRDLLPGGTTEAGAVATPVPPETLLLAADRRIAQRQGGSWTEIFRPGNPVANNPVLAVVAWYLALLGLGLLAFPLLFVALDNLADRGWAVARAGGLLLVAYGAWMVSSVQFAPHTPTLVWATVAALAVVSGAVAWRRRDELRVWLAANRTLVLAEEAVFLALFALFLAVRAGNPDLWHPFFGGEKPMDLAYLNATLRTVSFPPYDPWFAGGEMNYYYFGFVLVGALIELTGIPPNLAYNLALPSLAAMTGLGVAGVTYTLARHLGRDGRVAGSCAALAAVLAVVAGNLFQVRFLLADGLAALSTSGFRSHLPFVETVVRTIDGAFALARGAATLPISSHHLYWNASRAIPEQGDVVAITEFPFFTFLYADLHAHMMALPITVLALTAAVSWALPPGGDWRRELWRPGRLLALFLGALAIGALWPANTWDYPTYGLVAAGAIAVGHWRRFGRPSLAWVVAVGLQGAALLALSFALFWPHHATYVQPYADFSMWRSVKTPLSAYLVIHGVFLFAAVSWAIVEISGEIARRETRQGVLARLGVAVLAFGGVLGVLWLWSTRAMGPGAPYPPSPWTPAVGAGVLALGVTVLSRHSTGSGERFMAWLLVLGAALTMFVEYVVLSGDIGRMNTVFKFYIQVWVLWSVLAGASVAALAPLLRRTSAGRAWQSALVLLVGCALVYPVTAAPAKIRDRFPRQDPNVTTEDYETNWQPGLSGTAYEDYAVYDDDGHYLTLAYDRDGFAWFQQNVSGTPVILEGYRDKAYRWGSRYSIHTGLPTVVGWDWHQKQQRAAVGGQVVDERVAQVREIYETTDGERAWALLGDYGVEYVVVGEMERAFYAAEGLAKLDAWVSDGRAEVAYENPGVTIYQLVR